MGAGSLLLALTLSAFAAKPLPEPPRDYVHNEGVVYSESEARLSARLSAFEKETGHQFVVALFRSLDGDSLEDYSNRLFKHWRIGDAKRNDGVLLALFKEDRRWRVEVGYGLESTVTDLEAGRYLDDLAVPRFRQGDFDGGVEKAVSALVSRLGGRASPVPVQPRPRAHAPPEPAPSVSGFEYGMVIVLLVFFVGLLIHMLLSGVDWSSGGVSWSSGGSGGSSDWDSGGSSSSSCDSGGFSGGGGSSGGGGASGSW